LRITYNNLVRKRTWAILILFALAFLALAIRLVDIQVVRASKYAGIAKRIRSSNIPLPAERGMIFDRRGRTLAANIRADSIFAQPQQLEIEKKRVAATVLAGALGKDVNWCLDKLNSPRRFVWLLRSADPRIGLAVKEAVKHSKLSGIGIQERTKRVYPCSNTACHVIGFTDIDGNGLEGIEKAADSLLRGKYGYVLAELDIKRHIIPQTRGRHVQPVNGHHIALTIDANIQHIAEEELAKSVEDYDAAGGSVVVMYPKTGEILALANYPDFDPNKRSTFKAACNRNRAVTDMYEPGSTLKIVTASAALEEKAVKPETTFRCPGYLQVGKRKIKCVVHAPFTHGHGAVNLPKIIQYSCNVGAAQVGMRLGSDRLYEYEKKFGFGRKPACGVTGECPGFVAPPKSWSQVQLANVSFGQGIAVTPLQMACAYSVIAAGGVYHRPRIIKEIRSEDGKILSRHSSKGNRVISRETAAAIARMMTTVVDEGTGKSARIEGLQVAGKTGTAQKAPYGCGRYVGSFGGFLPANDPKLVIFVTIDEPKGSHYGSVVAAPVFREIARRVIWYMRVPHKTPDEFESARMAAGGRKMPVEESHGWRLGPAHVRREGKLGRIPSHYRTSAPA